MFEEGDPDLDVWALGTCQGVIDDVATCAELVERMVAESLEPVGIRINQVVLA